jgi:hypothetical protein
MLKQQVTSDTRWCRLEVPTPCLSYISPLQRFAQQHFLVHSSCAVSSFHHSQILLFSEDYDVEHK